MERKRKMPARAAARVDHVAKKRHSTPPDISATSTPPSAVSSPQPAESAAQEPSSTSASASASLPKSLQPGQPLPTVEKSQPEDLSNKDFQSIQESGVAAESLARSRQKWIHDGVFEKYWTKPTKRKGVVKEDANNPAKDTMAKIGQITMVVEPHLLEATMFAVKEPRLVPLTNSTVRPIIQYGPPNGAMPPPPKPTSSSTAASAPASSRSPAPIASTSQTPAQAAKQPKVNDKLPAQQTPSTSTSAAPLSQPQKPDIQRPQPPVQADKPVASPRGLESVLAAPLPPQPPVLGPTHSRPPQPPFSQPPATSAHPLHAPNAPPARPTAGAAPTPSDSGASAKATPPPKPGPSPGADPIIVTLAERASEDPHLRDLMKRVAVGEAAAHELAHFQRIIDQITLDYKKKGGQQGPSPDRLIVDGRTVKYFADEVRNISDIILASNPNQRSSDLRPPPGSDPLVILLVKETLDKPASKALVQRVAEGNTKYTDAVELKTLLDKLHTIVKQATAPSSSNTATPATSTPVKTEEGTKKSPPPAPAPASQQALRSKGPPPPTKPEISAVVLEFAGGTGDRYLFPKYSILEFSADGTQVVASFLIVRKGSKLEYGGDRALDYYQPITLRLQSTSAKVLENLARVVAPQDEVQRYMDDVMENMTRAEYVLLAMRLPRAEKEESTEDRSETPRASEASHATQLPGILWDSKPISTRPPSAKPALAKSINEDDQYQSFIKTIS
ncbi:hypothetical protein F5Y14DRAFT_111186 [Nemania sp. NC0429]|nr:hypothetical protein F5Y14DRAFT_111186 [Nemania sp. NC0429]